MRFFDDYLTLGHLFKLFLGELALVFNIKTLIKCKNQSFLNGFEANYTRHRYQINKESQPLTKTTCRLLLNRATDK